MSEIKVGKVYDFVGKYRPGDVVLTGEVLELIERNTVARVKLTKPAAVLLTEEGKGSQPGEVVRVFLGLVAPR